MMPFAGPLPCSLALVIHASRIFLPLDASAKFRGDRLLLTGTVLPETAGSQVYQPTLCCRTTFAVLIMSTETTSFCLLCVFPGSGPTSPSARLTMALGPLSTETRSADSVAEQLLPA